jgi:hypothetical protein
MITERFEIAVPDTPKSVNHGGGGVRGHWTTAVREKQRWQDTFSFELLAWGIPKDMLHCKVGATLFFKKRMRRDTENYRHPVIKPLADAFVAGGWLEDDTDAWFEVTGFRLECPSEWPPEDWGMFKGVRSGMVFKLEASYA